MWPVKARGVRTIQQVISVSNSKRDRLSWLEHVKRAKVFRKIMQGKRAKGRPRKMRTDNISNERTGW